jgi:hypothetical protein
MSISIRNRIKGHRRVRAGDLMPHEWNFRTHPQGQRAALAAIYQEIGFARSLLAYELSDGKLKLIDGHLRRDMDPDMEVEVEVLDVNEEEARALLLSIDPLASLAQSQQELQQRLLEITPTELPDLQAAWEESLKALAESIPEPPPDPIGLGPEQWLVLVTCRDEKEQVDVLERLTREGLRCRAMMG